MRTSVIHVKMHPKVAQNLKNLSKKRSVPVGELVRLAVSRCYQLDMTDLSEPQSLAVAAYQGGYISIGKLSEDMGITAIEARRWLVEHDIPQNNAFNEQDTKNA